MVTVKKGNDFYTVPDDFLYSPSVGNIGHTWARIEDGKVRVGITDYGQKQLKEIVFIQLPKHGDPVERLTFDGETPKSKPIGIIESQKTSIDFFSPVTGIIEEINDEIEDNPGLINQDPYEDGWILIITPSTLEQEKDQLWTAEKYAEELKNQ
ncbi:MAG: glycine cleavage system protein H [Candidatus Helarchaeota archaeon]